MGGVKPPAADFPSIAAKARVDSHIPTSSIDIAQVVHFYTVIWHDADIVSPQNYIYIEHGGISTTYLSGAYLCDMHIVVSGISIDVERCSYFDLI